jgi:hypothetical protein
MARNVSGSIESVVLDGISFDANADADINEMGSGAETTGIATSGRNAFKKTGRVQTREDVGLTVNAESRLLLEELANRLDPFAMSYTDASGNTYAAVGLIEFVNRQTMENLAVINMIPEGGWEAFLAG